MDEIMDVDVYDLFGVSSSATIQMIKKAYRKKALKCHPDKNPDNPSAAVLFLELSKALELLLDDAKRAAYDKIYNAKKAAKVRNQELDTRRRKLKEELEIREKLAQECSLKSHSYKTSEQKLAAEIERLRKEGSKQLQEEMESIKEQLYNAQLFPSNHEEDENTQNRLKVKWKSEKNDETNGGYNVENLTKIFSKYGDVAVIIISQKKKGSALVEFENADVALKASKYEKGYAENPLKLNLLCGKQSSRNSQNGTSSFNNVRADKAGQSSSFRNLFPSAPSSLNSPITIKKEEAPQINEDDYEAMVFAKLREAQNKKGQT